MPKNKSKHATSDAGQSTPSARQHSPSDFDPADERILDPSELLERIPLDRSTIYRMVQEGRFPAPIQLTPSRIGWKWSAVLRWISEREKHPVESRQYFGRNKEEPGAPRG
jgi:prophage regulatory protein